VQPQSGSGHTVFEVVGGQRFFDALVARFYARVAVDPILRPLHPEDLEPARDALALFLGRYWGGPTTLLLVDSGSGS
jgi:hemoglobin